ncbi:hypothetical protein M404DRAFT_997963 [Pisolithus tinctorius Marx 270]|uniref:Uncharacterized protein n=1 Tax=Pisolithus tinctorius Marx 270 TaxID=870435 RepID=A0A0C3JFH9_PISTI|nr:hypothetical protein M404DRAFT_997963 [Pisolithus tinctorius Marx 270]
MRLAATRESRTVQANHEHYHAWLRVHTAATVNRGAFPPDPLQIAATRTRSQVVGLAGWE